MSETRTHRRWVGAGMSIASALALVAAVLGFGPATGVGSAATGTGARAAATPSPTSSGGTQCVPSGEGGTTCTGTYGGDTAWDWSLNSNAGGMTGTAPSVTVDQTTGLTNQIVHVTWKNFTPSMTLNFTPGYVQGQELYGVGVFQCKAHPTDVTKDCNDLMIGTPASGATPTGVESYTLQGSSTQPTDCTSVPTDTVCGTGYTDMQIQTSVQNSSLGCDASHSCSLVVLPFWGGNNQVQPVNCADHSADLSFPGSPAQDLNNPWYSPCTWADRITIPLSFAPTPVQACTSTDYAFSAQGSPMLERVMGQWQPGWCTGASGTSKVVLNYDSTVNEYEARTSFLGVGGGGGLSSSTDVALVTDPPGSEQAGASSRQFTYAPIETTSITIAYYVDNQVTQEPITDLKLNARLVAKLLTESYSLSLGQCKTGQTTQSDLCDPKVLGNPVSIFTDPEFYQLNPEYTQADFVSETGNSNLEGDFLPIVLAGNSDMTYELTRWIYADPQARAFMQGEPDQWGMHVNTYYEQGQSQTYPISQFQVLDPGFSSRNISDPYLSTMQVAWNPVTGLDNVASDLAGWTPSGDQFAASCSGGVNTQPPCIGGNPINAKDLPVHFPQRALFAVLDSGTATAYRFPMAQLVNSAGDAVSPDAASMTAAVTAMKTNPDGITQYQDFNSTPANAYPLTEVQYAMVPTCGLTSTKARAVSTFLNDVADSQSYGVSLGQIPPFGGYLALNDKQVQQTLAAAQSVQVQNCKSAKQDTTVAAQTPSTPTSSSPLNNGNSPTTAAAPTAGRTTGLPAASASASPTPIGLGDKAADTSGDLKYILPAALAAGALLALGGPLAYGYGTTGGFRFRRPRLRRRGTHDPGSDGSGGGVDG